MSFRNRKRSTSLALVLLCTGATMATGAIARTTINSLTVSYVAADLRTPQGTEKLYQHIKRAAKIVCHQPSIRELGEYRLYKECYDRAVDSAVAKVDSTALTALHRRWTQHNAAG